MSMSTTEKLLETLKRVVPAQVVVYVGDEGRTVAVPKVKKRWSRVISTVDGMGAWSRVELLDQKGALLATIDNADPAAELQDLGQPTGKYAEIERIVGLVCRAQDRAMAMRSEEMRVAWNAQSEVTRVLMTGLQAQAQMHNEQMAAMRELLNVRTQVAAEAAAAAATADDEQSVAKQVAEAMPLIQMALPLLKGLLGQGEAPAAASANGVRGKH